MKFILGTKDGMTQVFSEEGVASPVTIVRVAPNVITQIRTADTDGYEAIQIATIEQKEARVAKAQRAHAGGSFAATREFRVRKHHQESLDGFEKGQTLDASVFAVGDKVIVSATSKGKGFQGVVKRHGFSGGKATHGNKDQHRTSGSIGATGPARVFKGTRMAGRMGADTVTVKNLTVVQVNKDENIILLKGAIPGRKGSIISVRGVAK
jgi:large subunit ribosomal protein L3